MKFLSIITLAFALLSLQAFAQQPQKPESYIVLDSVSLKVLLAKNSEQKRPIASLTKVATAKLVLGWARVSKTPLTTRILVPQSAALIGNETTLGLRPGDTMSIRDALYACLLSSDNVASHTLANYVGYDLLLKQGKQGDPVATFVKQMNYLAKDAGMKRTKFHTPHGLNNGKKLDKSTASDVARLSIVALKNPALAFMVKQKSRTITITRANKQTKKLTLYNTNKLLGKQGIVGLKTGFTSDAGQCLGTVADKRAIVTSQPDGKKLIRHRQLIIVLLGSNDRFKQTSSLVKQGWHAYDQWGKSGFYYAKKKRDTLRMPTRK